MYSGLASGWYFFSVKFETRYEWFFLWAGVDLSCGGCGTDKFTFSLSRWEGINDIDKFVVVGSDGTLTNGYYMVEVLYLIIDFGWNMF